VTDQIWPRLRRVLLPLIASHVLGFGAFITGTLTAEHVIGPPPNTALTWSLIDHHFRLWDADSYTKIAENGYPGPGDTVNQHLAAFLPLYPLLIRVLMITGLSSVVSGLLISLVAETIALIFIDMLVSSERDDRAGLFAVWFMALAPMGIFLDVVYTESTFLAAAAASLYFMRRGRFGAASLAATVAAATRITGVVLGPVLLAEWVRRLMVRRRQQDGPLIGRHLLMLPAFAAPVLPFLLFSLYLGVHTGDFNAWHHAQAGTSFNHDIAAPWTGFWVTWNQMIGATDPETYQTWFREVVFGLIGLVACIIAWLDRAFPRSLALYCSLVLVVSTSISFWLSVPRYLLALFPITIVIVDLTTRARWLWPMIVLTTAAIFTWSGYVYGTGHWVA
jgi:hypothetical protein